MGEYEYKTIKVPGRGLGSARARDRILNRWAAAGWEPVDFQRKGALDWGSKSTVTLRRRRGPSAPSHTPPDFLGRLGEKLLGRAHGPR